MFSGGSLLCALQLSVKLWDGGCKASLTYWGERFTFFLNGNIIDLNVRVLCIYNNNGNHLFSQWKWKLLLLSIFQLMKIEAIVIVHFSADENWSYCYYCIFQPMKYWRTRFLLLPVKNTLVNPNVTLHANKHNSTEMVQIEGFLRLLENMNKIKRGPSNRHLFSKRAGVRLNWIFT